MAVRCAAAPLRFAGGDGSVSDGAAWVNILIDGKSNVQ